MNLAFGVAFMWAGASLYYLATHDLGATTPWGAFSALMAKLRESAEASGAPADGDVVKAGARATKAA